MSKAHLMTSKNVKDEAWIMTGGSRNHKGVIRNVLLCFLARQKSEHEQNVKLRVIQNPTVKRGLFTNQIEFVGFKNDQAIR